MITWMDELRVRQAHLKSHALQAPKSAFDVEHHAVEAAGQTAAEGPLHLVAAGEARRQLEELMAMEESGDDNDNGDNGDNGGEALSAAHEELKGKLREAHVQRRQDLEQMQELETETKRLGELGQQQEHEVRGETQDWHRHPKFGCFRSKASQS